MASNTELQTTKKLDMSSKYLKLITLTQNFLISFSGARNPKLLPVAFGGYFLCYFMISWRVSSFTTYDIESNRFLFSVCSLSSLLFQFCRCSDSNSCRLLSLRRLLVNFRPPDSSSSDSSSSDEPLSSLFSKLFSRFKI